MKKCNPMKQILRRKVLALLEDCEKVRAEANKHYESVHAEGFDTDVENELFKVEKILRKLIAHSTF